MRLRSPKQLRLAQADALQGVRTQFADELIEQACRRFLTRCGHWRCTKIKNFAAHTVPTLQNAGYPASIPISPRASATMTFMKLEFASADQAASAIAASGAGSFR